MSTRYPALASLGLLLAAGVSQAGWSVGINFGAPYYRPYYRPYWHRPAVVVAPAYPVYVAPPPVVVRPAPVVAVPAYQGTYEYDAPPPAVPAVPDARPVEPQPAPRLAPAPAADLRGLNDPSPKARAQAMIQAGRQKDGRAVPVLTRALKEDTSAEVRETAARALGLIGEARSLQALQHAAQADDDRDVRKSASFAAEVIRANLRR